MASIAQATAWHGLSTDSQEGSAPLQDIPVALTILLTGQAYQPEQVWALLSLKAAAAAALVNGVAMLPARTAQRLCCLGVPAAAAAAHWLL
jgi:hypothetical protein